MKRVCLKSGRIMDGTGKRSFIGDVLVENGRIQCISQTPLEVDCPVIDCTGLAIAPGFIDSHSHMDNYMFYDNDQEYTECFIRQGITTFVAGQCGYGVAGIAKDSPYKADLCINNDAHVVDPKIPMNTYAEYFDYLRQKGIRLNMATMIGHGTTMGSITGLILPQGPSSPEVKKKIKYLLEQGLDEGCKGISFGFGYRPASFLPESEIREMAELAINRNKLITVHSRILGSHSPSVNYGDSPEPHNIRWHREFLELFQDSAARLQISHLIFVGRSAWPTYEPMMEMLQGFMDHGGMDLWFDLFSYTQGVTTIGLRMPQFFYDHCPQILNDESLWPALDEVIRKDNEVRGVYPDDMLLCDAFNEEYNQYRGKTLGEIMKERNISMGQLSVELYRNSNGYAQLYILVEHSDDLILREMVHPRALYMTDAWIIPGSLQNPCCYGTMPRFLRLARETNNQTMEETIAKMTGNAAIRYDLYGRGFIREGYAADIVVFNPDTVAETATSRKPDTYPIGIEHVFINGEHILNQGQFDHTLKVGSLLL